MAAVLPRIATDLRLFHPELSASTFATESAYSASPFQRHSPASFVMYDSGHSSYHSSPGTNKNSQPCSSSPAEPRCSIAPLYSSPHSRSQDASPLGSTFPLVSPGGMIVVLDYTPSEGEANIPVTVNLELRANGNGDTLGHNMSMTSLKLRLVFGCAAVRTTVKRLPPSMLHVEGSDGHGHGCNSMRLRLHASAPPHSEVRFPDLRVPLTIQAMDDATNVLESFTFGVFTYWAPATIRPTAVIDMHKVATPTSPAQNKRKREEDDSGNYLHHAESDSEPMSNSPKKTFFIPPPPRTDKGSKLVRTTNVPTDILNGAEAQPAALEWVVDNGTLHPNSLDKKWSAHELAVGRRLIRFGREMSGNKLRVSCEVIPQEAYDEQDIVISCVYRQETRNCWFTSVDVIYLLERLVGGPFSVEEKNRIRRNLEGFKPTTVSKTKGGFEMFFQRIMDFPPPKPRNIEKDVKVFAWSLLVPALDKIISKYSVIPTSDSDSSPQSQESSSLSSSSQPTRATKAARSRSSSSNSQGVSEEADLSKPLKSAASRQSLHMVVESPQMIHPDLTTHVPEPDSMPLSMNHYYFPELGFPGEDQWRRRESITPLGTMPTHTNDYYPNHGSTDLHATPGPLHTHAFSNPFASDVNLGTISLGGHGPGQGLDASADMHGGINADVHGHGMQFDASFADDVFESRRSSLASDALYPMSGSPPNGNHDALTTTYGTGSQDTHNVPHEFLYAQFHASSQHQLPLKDGNAQ